MSKYDGLATDALFDTYRKKQRHLIIPNILVMIMAVVTIFFSVLVPMFKVKIHINGDNLTEIVNTLLGDEADSSAGETAIQTLNDAVKDLDLNFTVALYPLDVIKVAVNGDDASALFSNMFGDIYELVDDIVNTIVVTLTETLGNALIDLLVAGVGQVTGLPDGAADALEDAFNSLGDGNADKAKEYLTEFFDILVADDNLQISEEDANSQYNDLCDLIDGSVDAEGNFKLTLFASAFIKYAMGADSEAYSELQSLLEQLNELDADAIADGLFAIDEETSATTVRVALVLVLVTVGLCALMWAILLLSALIHTLSKNRRFVTWYVKLFAWIPGVLFYILPTVALANITKLVDVGEWESAINSFKTCLSFGGSGIASGICYILLWLVSIFWLFPIKHGIRACKKQLTARGVTKKELKG